MMLANGCDLWESVDVQVTRVTLVGGQGTVLEANR